MDIELRNRVEFDAKWLSCDEDGFWYAWDRKPRHGISIHGWISEGNYVIVYKQPVNPHWKDSLVNLTNKIAADAANADEEI